MQPPHPQYSGRVPGGCRKFPQRLKSSKTSDTTTIAWASLLNKGGCESEQTKSSKDNSSQRVKKGNAALAVLSAATRRHCCPNHRCQRRAGPFRTSAEYLIITGNNIGPMTSKIAPILPLVLHAKPNQN